MLWLALCLPSLPLEALLRGHAPHEREAWAVAEDRSVIACDARARALGVRTGMGLAAASAIAPQLCVRTRDEAIERAALEGIAVWAGRFTPFVSLEPPQGVVAEIEGSLRLFDGLAPLAHSLRTGLGELGFSATLAAAPTARGAWWLAAAGRKALIETHAALEPALAPLPVAVACAEPGALALLRNVGVATVGALVRLPRAGLARRLGARLLDDLDRALGKRPEPRAYFAPPPRFAARLELPGEVTHAEGVLFAARRLLAQLEGLLAARQAGVRRFVLTLLHRNAPAIAVEVRLASPGRETARFVELLRERLAAVALVEPVEAIRLEASAFVPLHGHTAGLFGDARAEGEGWARLVERLQARLGGEAVHGLGLNAEHRPEHAWRMLAPGERLAPGAAQLGPRPLWLIQPPRRLRETSGVPHGEGPLELLAGPERIESGWWDGGDVARDYFIARAAGTALLWVYREPGGGWYLHGLFA